MKLLDFPAPLVDRIHKTPTKAVIFATGGGLGVFEELTHRGGGSATLLSGLIPYDQQETVDLLGGTPKKFVSEETTRQMAVVAYQRAVRLSKGEYPVIGVALNTVLQRVPDEREGREHIIYAALQMANQTVSVSIVLPADKRTKIGEVSTLARLTAATYAEFMRVEEEKLAVYVILNLIAEGCGLEERLFDFDDSNQNFHVGKPTITVRRSTMKSDYFADLYSGKIKALAWDVFSGIPSPISAADAFMCAPEANDVALHILPGSFNPFHDGHLEIAKMTSQKYGGDVVDFEMSIRNVDKPPLDILSIEERLRTFKTTGRVWLTNAPTFVEKSAIFQNKIFVVGIDTAVRICDAKYAGNVDQVCDTLNSNGTHFLVYGRSKDGIEQPSIETLPSAFRNIATQVSSDGRQFVGISSTDIRSQKTLGSGS